MMSRVSIKKIRITVVGDGGIGKTSMLIAYKDRTFLDSAYVPTVFDEGSLLEIQVLKNATPQNFIEPKSPPFDIYSMTVPINDEDYTIILSDTAGQEEYDKLRQFAYKNVDIFILCFALDERSSFENIKSKWIPEIQHSCPKSKIIIAGTKADSTDKRITESEGKKLARSLKVAGFIMWHATNFE